jgi:hypothetical protein
VRRRERKSRGSTRAAHRRRKRRGTSGNWPAAVSHGDRLGLHATAAFRRTSYNGMRKLVVGLASPEEQRIQRIDGGEPAAALGSAAWSGSTDEGAAGLGLGCTGGSRPQLYRHERERLTWRARRGKAAAAPRPPWPLVAKPRWAPRARPEGMGRSRLGRVHELGPIE